MFGLGVALSPNPLIKNQFNSRSKDVFFITFTDEKCFDTKALFFWSYIDHSAAMDVNAVNESLISGIFDNIC